MSACEASSSGAAAPRISGALLVAGAAVAWSTGGLFVRLIELDPWTILFWRSLVSVALLTSWLALRQRLNAFTALSRNPGAAVLVVSASALGMFAFIPALQMTSVANVAIIHAALPVITSIIAWAALRERLNTGATLAGLAVLAGSALVLGGSAASGGSLLGDLLALVMTLSMAVMMLALHRNPTLPILPLVIAANLVTVIGAAPMARALAVGATDLLWLILFGAVHMTLGLALFSAGTQRMASTDAALVVLIEAPLAPLWVLIAFGEVPALATMAAGVVILTAVAFHLLSLRRMNRRRRQAAAPIAVEGRPP